MSPSSWFWPMLTTRFSRLGIYQWFRHRIAPKSWRATHWAALMGPSIFRNLIKSFFFIRWFLNLFCCSNDAGPWRVLPIETQLNCAWDLRRYFVVGLQFLSFFVVSIHGTRITSTNIGVAENAIILVRRFVLLWNVAVTGSTPSLQNPKKKDGCRARYRIDSSQYTSFVRCLSGLTRYR